MKIGIFNEHFNTMGGGEKHIGAIAEYLVQKGHDVQFVTFEDFDLSKLEKKLNLNLSGCSTVLLDNHYQAEEFSKTYDFFINSSYQCAIKPKAEKNAILIFFPIIPKYKWIAKSLFAQKMVKYINRCSGGDDYIFQSGFYSLERTGKYSGHWTKQNFSVKIKSIPGEKSVEIVLYLAPISRLKIDERIISAKSRNGVPLKLVGCSSKKIIFHIQSPREGEIIDFSLAESFKSEGDPRSLGIFVEQVEIRPALGNKKTEIRKSIFFQFLRGNVKKIPLLRSMARCLIASSNLGMSLIGRVFSAHSIFRVSRFLTRRVRDYDYLEYYDLILANSKYTQGWIKKYWGREGEILYPKVDVEEFFNSEEKENKIISVGRFFKGGHSKKQLMMVKVFKKMVDGGLKDWEYHLCGGTHQGKVHQNYLKAIGREARDYPIFIHSDIPFPELKKLYAKSSIFWHAAGYGENENKNPDKFEHFGITTVEAMASGCIPIVINKAGQKEIVVESKNGFLWNFLSELNQKTIEVINLSGEEKDKLRNIATEKSKRYSGEKFREELEKIFSFLQTKK